MSKYKRIKTESIIENIIMLEIKEIKPLFTSILTTGDKYDEDMRENGIIVANKGDLKLYQKVLAVGSSVRDVHVGDMVMFDPKNYAVMKYNPNSLKNDMDMNKVIKWNFPWVNVNGSNCLLLDQRDLKYVFVGEEKNESIILPNRSVIYS